MEAHRLPLKSGTLWPTLVHRTREAIACGALHPIHTAQELVEDRGIRFLVRKVSSLARKDEEKRKRSDQVKQSGKDINPFLPYEEALFVADVSRTHVCLLNKFNVIDHHLLIVTHQFEHQEALLTRNDFQALMICMAEFEGLGFYNGGVEAGASQPHKHLQMVPLPLITAGFRAAAYARPAVPIEPLLPSARFEDEIGVIPAFSFVHAFCRLDRALGERPPVAAEAAIGRYHALLDTVGLKAIMVGGEPRQSAPYNLLMTRDWMLVVPRSRECFASISVNALGFAGSLFVRNEAQRRAVKRYGPMALLRAVAIASR